MPFFVGCIKFMLMVKQVKQRHVPERTCVACRTSRPKRALVRLVYTDDGIVVDETGKRNGRGAYLCRRLSCWTLALNRGSLNKALRTTLRPEDIAFLREYALSLADE